MCKGRLFLSVLAILAIVGFVTQARASNTKIAQPEVNAEAAQQGPLFRVIRVEKEPKPLTVESAVSLLHTAALTNGLEVVGVVNEGAAPNASRSRTLQAQSLLVENPADAKTLLTQDPAAALAVPTRIAVFERDGHLMIGYMPPSEFLKGLKGKTIHDMGVTMDRELLMTVTSVAK